MFPCACCREICHFTIDLTQSLPEFCTPQGGREEENGVTSSTTKVIWSIVYLFTSSAAIKSSALVGTRQDDLRKLRKGETGISHDHCMYI